MFTIIIKTTAGWTDNLGPGPNEWATEEEANRAIADLQSVGFSSDPDDWKIVPADRIESYDLVA